MTSAKVVELQSLAHEGDGGGVNILCMIKTQQKYKKVYCSEKMAFIEKMREIYDKQVGGITVIMHRKNTVELHQKECADPDIMMMDINVGAILINNCHLCG